MKFEFEGQEIEVRNPTTRDHLESRLFSGGIFKKAAEQENPPPPREKLSSHLTKLGIWDKSKQERLDEISKELDEGEKQLSRGAVTKDGEPFSKQDAKDLAIKMLKLRREWYSIAVELHQYNHYSLEGIVEEANMNFLVYCCSYKNGERLYSSYEDYVSKQNSELAYKCMEQLQKNLNGDRPREDEPEEKFLKKYGFMNEKGFFIVDGKLTDINGKFVNEEGKYVDEHGNLVNFGGERVDAEGNPIIEFVEFSD